MPTDLHHCRRRRGKRKTLISYGGKRNEVGRSPPTLREEGKGGGEGKVHFKYSKRMDRALLL